MKKILILSGMMVALSAGAAQARTYVNVGFYSPAPVYAVAQPVYYGARPIYVDPYPVYNVRYVKPHRGKHWHHNRHWRDHDRRGHRGHYSHH